ncbi:hypothetical protein [Halovenus marina]|uniref:hypothetical protein n=1 Tax=Halovenus marina TaxID=3396621 RepID=UPI003F57121C
MTPQNKASEDALDHVRGLVEGLAGRADIETGLNGWPTLEAVGEYSDRYSVSHVKVCIHILANRGDVVTATSTKPGVSEFTTVVPADYADPTPERDYRPGERATTTPLQAGLLTMLLGLTTIFLVVILL